jgi:hypothetical protein
MEQLINKIFRAVDDEEACLRYIDGHRKVLEAFGVTKVTSSKADWMHDPNTYVISIESEDRTKILGGGRIQIRSEHVKMPMEPAIAILDQRIYPYVEELGNYKVAEFCGLWNSKEVAGYGVGSIVLGRLGVALVPLLGLEYLMALCSPATLRNCLKVGFTIIRDLGSNGTLYYPKEDLIATALIIKDPVELTSASPEDRRIIHQMRKEPYGLLETGGPKGSLTLSYDLRVDSLQST